MGEVGVRLEKQHTTFLSYIFKNIFLVYNIRIKTKGEGELKRN